MATTFKPQYGTRTAITITLDNLANAATATSNAIDNSSNLFEDFMIELYIDGTAATTAYLEVRLLPSNDNSAFASWTNGVPLGVIDLTVDQVTAIFSLLNALYIAPKYFKIAVMNVTGAALAASGNVANYMGVNRIGA
jgi:hypothetical protein